MASLLERKLKARGQLHARLRVPATYYPSGECRTSRELVHVREHYRFQTVGGLTANVSSYAEREEYRDPVLVFDAREVSPVVNAVAVLSTGAVYRVIATQPPDGFTVTADVERVVGSRASLFFYGDVEEEEEEEEGDYDGQV